ncbi:MAG: GntR family transcriptional regulator [Tunicatimonas sp.]|uniref:FadR/GntR family transcriptional regulator n=1 Tax=Tunicatimonas sp. TaxID=1940096 RepID=UPI003C765A81
MSSANNHEFKPIVQPSMTELVEEQIRNYLKAKKLKPGDAIPKEMEIAEQLGVSRSVIREAISRFKMLGLIESRKRRGMILTEPDLFKGLERVLDPNLLGQDTLIDIFEMRLVLEMGLAELLFAYRTDQYIAELEKIASKNVSSNQAQFILQQEVKFHGKLYEITHNQSLQRFQKLLLPVFQHIIDVEQRGEFPQIVSQVDHASLVDIYRNGDPNQFRQGMYEHLKPHYYWIAEYKKNQRK